MENTNQTPNTAPTNQTSPAERKADLIRLYSRLEGMKLQHVPTAPKAPDGFPKSAESLEFFECKVCGSTFQTILREAVASGCPKCEHDRLGILADHLPEPDKNSCLNNRKKPVTVMAMGFLCI
ncbi:hypothetical protein EQ856_13505 [Enterococcus hirae]|uniref:hypothetical protein n=1 Tax=Enterococcus hirae TaxID=1354 RepID=UPI000FF87709|nr:hypothetical protein [Enterococcus hirae]MDB7249280.1 hypothetical protein [Enterococcus faecium]EMF0175268.1 hypothetical protein [Enterococcus hirae]EMF0506780.1 hypothetical protein [Enterococcus hirae]MDB7254433.1 hypothetical protein [Enterococcus faecium]MDB7256894.1 hypothetical protein [Enterococcus faecium]